MINNALEQWIEQNKLRAGDWAKSLETVHVGMLLEFLKGKALLPIEPNMTAEMKAAHMGEYFVTIEIECPDECEADEDCGHCEGTGLCDHKIAIPWPVCKQIFKAMYATAVDQAISPTTSAGEQS